MAEPESHEEGPDWDLLPSNPMSFFGLEVGFDRTALKRSYNRLIRRFKPEKHPAEFQRLRAAYEELEHALRYGNGDNPAWAVAGDPSQGPAPPEAASADVPGAETPGGAFFFPARLENGESPEAIYAEVRAATAKAPSDYFALAVLSDTVEHDPGEAFLDWLLAGLVDHPGDASLSRLAYGCLADQISVDDLPAALKACAQAVPNDSFYAISEPAWERVLQERGFAEFASLLAACEVDLRPDGFVGSRIAFLLRMLRRTVWEGNAADEWNEGAYDFIESNFDQAPDVLHNDIDLIGILREYTAQRGEFATGDPIRAQLDATLKAVFTESQADADRAILACQRRIAAQPEEIAAAFPIGNHPGAERFFTLWSWVSADAAERMVDAERTERDEVLLRGRVHELLIRLRDQKSWVKTQSNVASILLSFLAPVIIGGGFLVGVAMCGVLGVGVLEVISPRASDGLAMLAASLGVLVFAYPALRGYGAVRRRLHEYWAAYETRLIEASYQRVWRPAVFEFQNAAMIDYFALRELMGELVQAHADDARGWIHHYVGQDYGLAFYSISQRFRA